MTPGLNFALLRHRSFHDTTRTPAPRMASVFRAINASFASSSANVHERSALVERGEARGNQSIP
jgi:hypothetical protein